MELVQLYKYRHQSGKAGSESESTINVVGLGLCIGNWYSCYGVYKCVNMRYK